MYQDPNMLASIRKVEAAREENIKLDPRRMTADEKDALLKKFHPDYRTEQFTELRFGPNKGQKVPLELADLLEGESRVLHEQFDLTIEKQKIVQAEPIKSFGAYEVKCKLGYEVTGTIHVLVIEEK
mgnify:FL=1